MTKIKSTSALIAYRDLLKKQAELTLKPAEEALAKAKAAYHDAKIESNRLTRLAQEVQEAITLEMQQEYDELQRLQEEYRFKTNCDLSSQEDLMQLYGPIKVA